jgi:hypothetical protein
VRSREDSDLKSLHDNEIQVLHFRRRFMKLNRFRLVINLFLTSTLNVGWQHRRRKSLSQLTHAQEKGSSHPWDFLHEERDAKAKLSNQRTRISCDIDLTKQEAPENMRNVQRSSRIFVPSCPLTERVQSTFFGAVRPSSSRDISRPRVRLNSRKVQERGNCSLRNFRCGERNLVNYNRVNRNGHSWRSVDWPQSVETP